MSISGTLPEKLTAISEAGFDGVEIFENDLLACPLSPEEIRLRAQDLGLSIDLYQPFRDFEAVTDDILTANVRRAEHKFAVMERLGADLLLVCSSVSPYAIDDDELAAAQLRLLAERAARHGIRIAYEALAWGGHVDDYLHAWRIVQLADHPNLGTCLDSFHILSRGSDPIGIEAIPGEKIFFLQLADAPVLAMDVLQWSRHYRCFPGQGGLDVADLVRRALRAGYAGPLSLEVFNDVFRQADATRTARDAIRSLILLEEQLASEGTLPAAPPPTGFAFAELSTSDPPGLGDLLSALGFARTGRHLSKPVELWQQGAARILLNGTEEPPALAAIGLESPAPVRSVQRAEALHSPVRPRIRADGEARLDAVEAPDGTQIFFCRSADAPGWLDDFRTVAAPASGEISHLDHVALTQPWHYFDEATLFYRSIVGLFPQGSEELPDPYGLLRSRAMTSPDGNVRIVLNVAHVGAGAVPWQHLALASTDIVATARRLRRLDPSLLLPVPGNYHDDLEARHDVGPELRELGLMYDRDARGEFLHLYTVTVGRVFFEIVQRIGGYQGYGAGNAPVRLAVQHAGLAD